MISIQTKIWYQRAGILSEDKSEEPDSPKKASPDTKGKLHELLVGYHLNGGKHMEKHKDKEGDSPEEAHNKLKHTVDSKEYDTINKRAKSAADDIKKRVEGQGHKVTHVHWTSKPGDIEKSTGIKSSQKDDASDIIVHSKKGNKIKHHGISLKVSDKSTKHVPASNPGIESTHGGEHILNKHRESLHNVYPVLKHLSPAERRNKMKSDHKFSADVKQRNERVLKDISSNLHDKLNKMKPHELVHHIKTHVLQANPTPMQNSGHEHIRHTTSTKSNGSFEHHAIDPSHHWHHILSEPHHITTQNTGTGVSFLHKGHKFASHRIKFSSQSDPLSSIKGSGQAHGD